MQVLQVWCKDAAGDDAVHPADSIFTDADAPSDLF